MNKKLEVIGMILCLTAFLHAQSSEATRKAEVAGMFYPSDPQKLSAMIDGFLSQTDLVIKEEIGGLVSPHAGYVYSGQVAAWSYRQIQGKHFDVVVVISPSHFEYFSGASVYPGKYYQTPLGSVTVDQQTAKAIADEGPSIKLSESGHTPDIRGRGEHALEVQLPFLQKVLGDFPLVPIVMADQSWQNVQNLGDALANVLKDKKALIVASSDLSHYHRYNVAYDLDQKLIDLFNAYDYKEIINECERHQIEACGYGPIATMMYACSKLGFIKSKVIQHATSGDVPVGEKAQVVGYMSGIVYR